MTTGERETRRVGLIPLAASLVLAALSVTVAGCGGGSRNADTAARDTGAAALDWARCMRKHGADVPDPQTDANGRLVIVGGARQQNRRDPAYERALQDCRDLFERARPRGAREASAEERERFLESALRFARCMRKHGVELPDPVASERQMAMPLPPGANPESPSFRRAHSACSRFLPPPATS